MWPPQLCLLVWCVVLQGLVSGDHRQSHPTQLLSIARSSLPHIGGKEGFSGPEWKSLAREGQKERHKRSFQPPPIHSELAGQCSEVNTSRDGLPHSAVGWLTSGCTAFLVGPRHLLTAGHCVYNHQGWQADGLEFYRTMR